jgi:Flp pilus assembly protein TadG
MRRDLFFEERGTTAAEFALVLPVALLLFFGIIDGGRYMWTVNRLEKAVQMGTRTAVVTGVVPTGLNSWDFTTSGVECPGVDSSGNPTSGPIDPGSTICAEALGTITCTRASAGADVTCTCTPTAAGSGSCPSDLGTPNAEATGRFSRIVARMRVVERGLTDDEVRISYSGSGVGYAGDPVVDDDGNELVDAAPTVTVSVDRPGMRTLFLLGGRIPLPAVSYSQTLEDGDGAVAY